MICLIDRGFDAPITVVTRKLILKKICFVCHMNRQQGGPFNSPVMSFTKSITFSGNMLAFVAEKCAILM